MGHSWLVASRVCDSAGGVCSWSRRTADNDLGNGSVGGDAYVLAPPSFHPDGCNFAFPAVSLRLLADGLHSRRPHPTPGVPTADTPDASGLPVPAHAAQTAASRHPPPPAG